MHIHSNLVTLICRKNRTAKTTCDCKTSQRNVTEKTSSQSVSANAFVTCLLSSTFLLSLFSHALFLLSRSPTLCAPSNVPPSTSIKHSVLLLNTHKWFKFLSLCMHRSYSSPSGFIHGPVHLAPRHPSRTTPPLSHFSPHQLHNFKERGF